jgi:ArsR family transcriptional regulator
MLEHGELCVCDLMEALELPQSKISRHMSFLKKSGWVVSRRSGKWVYYRLAEPDDAIQAQVLSVLSNGLGQVPQAVEDYQRLCDYLETKHTEKCD